MDLTDGEQEILRGMRAITLDKDGYEVFVGLTASESEEFLALSRRNDAGENLSDDPRFRELQQRHEAERQRIVMGERSLDPGTHLR